jgi:hypothetical protein
LRPIEVPSPVRGADGHLGIGIAAPIAMRAAIDPPPGPVLNDKLPS